MISKRSLLVLTGIFFCFCLFAIFIPVSAQDDSLPPMVISAGDFPFSQGQSVTMQKHLWGDKNEISVEISVMNGTKSLQGGTAQVVKTMNTNGDVEEDYFTKDSSSVMYLGTTRENLDKLVPAKNFQFPLQLNSEWTVLDKEISGKHVLMTSKVVSQEFVRVPAGIYQTLKIAVTSGFTDEKRVENSVYMGCSRSRSC